MNFRIVIFIFLTFFNLYGFNLSQLQKLEEFQLKKNKNDLNFETVPKSDNQSVIIENNITQHQKILDEQEKNNTQKIKNISIFKYQTNQDILNKRIDEQISIDEKNLTRFGDNFFNNGNLINSNLMPVPNNYQISIGDSISIWLYGKKNINTIFQVDKNGFIHIKNIGSIYVYNLRFDKLKELLTNKFKRIYKNIKVHISLQKTVPIQITIAGEVNSPGVYNIPSFSTIKEALIASKGISEFGSYRAIRLFRQGKLIKTFDLYKFIKNGKGQVVKFLLKNGDAIIVSRAKKIIKIQGYVQTEGIYELRKNENLKTLLKYAGLKAEATKSFAKINRIINHKTRQVLDISLNKNIVLKNGDIVSIFPVVKNGNFIFLLGNITQPGKYNWSQGLTLYNFLKTEIQRFGGLDNFFLKNLDLDYAVIKRFNINTFKEEIIHFSLRKLLLGKIDIPLNKGDEIHIFNKLDLQENQYIYVDGTVVANPGKYQYFDNMKLFDVLKFVQFKNDLIDENETRHNLILSDEVEIQRFINKKIETFFLKISKDNNFSIQPFDNIKFFDKFEREEVQMASIFGEVIEGGKFVIDENTDINKLILMAKGLKKSAYLDKFEVVRYKVVNGEGTYEILKQSLKDAMKNKFKIQEFDKVHIFKIPKWNESLTCEIKGEVKFPGKYIVKKGTKFSELLTRAGGYLDSAFLDGAIFSRISVKELQKKRLKESVRRLKRDLTTVLTNPNVKDAKAQQQLIQVIQSLIKEMSEFEPIGRISVNFNDISLDPILEDGDQIFIPTKNEVVTVLGEVLNNNSFLFKSGLTVEDYISKAGGLTEKANEDNIYVIHANGEAEKYEPSYLFGDNIELNNGDTIIIPPKLDISSYREIAKDVSQILYQFAITAISLKTVGAF